MVESTKIKIALAKMGYTMEWIFLGIVNEQLIFDQIDLLDDDPNTEHHRYGSMIKFLNMKTTFEDDVFQSLLIILDKEIYIKESSYLYMYENCFLTESQHEIIKVKILTFGKWAEERIFLLELKNRLRNATITQEEIINIIKREDPKSQRLIVEYSNDRNILEELLEITKFKKIRNVLLHKLPTIK